MKIIVLWTDALIYILIALIIWGFFKIVQDQNARKKWGTILHRPLNVVAIMVLICFFTIGILDTIHLRADNSTNESSTNVTSVLGLMLKGIADRSEKTYSAPFATHLFSKEPIRLSDGTIIRDYPKLKYGGSHLKPNEDKWHDIGLKSLEAFLKALILSVAFSISLLFIRSSMVKMPFEDYLNKIKHGQSQFPWRTFLSTFFILLFVILWLSALMPYYHVMGTNEVGDDVLLNTIKSIRTGLIIGTVTTLITLPFAILFGIAAGYFKGKIDDTIQYTYTLLSSIPSVLLIAAAVMTLQLVFDRHPDWFQTVAHRSDARLLALCAILGITSWTGLCRLLRGESLKLKETDFVQAAKALGVRDFTIIFKHLLPNVLHIIIITIILDFSGLVLAEAVLSYVGVGVDPSTMSWGTMINGARLEMARVPVVWWNLTAAFIFMFTLVLAANIFSDAIRDAYDPRMQKRT